MFAARRARRPFQFKGYVPPAGSYDPALDAQRAAAGRGLRDVREDFDRANLRELDDYGIQREDIGRGQARGLDDLGERRADLARQWQYGQQDLATSAARGAEDYQRNVAMLTRRYQQLASGQQEQQNSLGVLRGGAALQAAAKRAENEALDRQPLDAQYARFVQDNQLRAQRMLEGQQDAAQQLGTAQTRLSEDSDLARARLGLGSTRGFQDRVIQKSRAEREAAAFGLDLDAQRIYQASGWVPPAIRRRRRR